jgi:hypothetical protein
MNILKIIENDFQLFESRFFYKCRNYYCKKTNIKYHGKPKRKKLNLNYRLHKGRVFANIGVGF